MLIVLIQSLLLQIFFNYVLMFDLNNEHLMLYINCDGSFQDSSDNQIPITNFFSTFTTDRHQHVDKACYFNENSYISGSASLLPTTSRTVTLWFKSYIDQPSTLLSYGGGVKCSGFALEIRDKNSPKCVFHTFCTSTGSNLLSADLSPYSLLEWTHIALTIGQTRNVIYINGDQVSFDTAYYKNTDVTDKEFSLGRPTFPSELDGYFDILYFIGAMDEIRIYDIDYPPEDIREIYSQEKNSPPTLAKEQSTTFIYQDNTQISESITKYFEDADYDNLTYSIQMKDGSPLPSWLSFSSGTIVSSSVTTVPGIYQFLIQAYDSYSASPQILLTLQIGQASCSNPGYSWINDECINCGDYIPYCKSCKGTSRGDCIECEENYTLSSSGTCDYHCLDENCLVCTKNVCSSCKKGYGVILQSYQCRQCSNSICATCIFGHTETCANCVANYEPENANSNHCIEIVRYCYDLNCKSCSSKNSNDMTAFIKGSTCYKMCSVKNCMECSSLSSCKACFPDFTLQDNGCYSTNCFDKCELCSSTTCVKCTRGFFVGPKGNCLSFYLVVFPVVFTTAALIIIFFLIWSVIRFIRRKRLLILAQRRQRQNQAPNINPNMQNNRNQNIIEINFDNPQLTSKKKKCVLCSSTMIFGKTQCGCYLCYRHCNEIKVSLLNKENIVEYQRCPDHHMKIEEIFDLKEENQLPTYEDQGMNSQDSMQGKCMICFEGESKISFNCGCRAMVCTNCYENHVGIYKHIQCPFCRRMINGELENKI